MTENTKEIIKSTAPLLKEKKDEITETMYKILFEKYPETKILFKDASDDQPKKLANAIYAYANNIDNLGNLQKGLETMVKAHVKTNIKPEHYPMVQDALLSSIKKTLGEVCTKDVENAWSSAYEFLANILINKEKLAYSKA
ncbi:MAG: globin domain-containing protein [Poseidonibacter sp.]|uniref:globin domain-containing protein n=1 Tax=Poseidonibacter sp. TaxID=2321188 RepID=UPI00359EB3F4